jgi:hypothetical protein
VCGGRVVIGSVGMCGVCRDVQGCAGRNQSRSAGFLE